MLDSEQARVLNSGEGKEKSNERSERASEQVFKEGRGTPKLRVWMNWWRHFPVTRWRTEWAEQTAKRASKVRQVEKGRRLSIIASLVLIPDSPGDERPIPVHDAHEIGPGSQGQ